MEFRTLIMDGTAEQNADRIAAHMKAGWDVVCVTHESVIFSRPATPWWMIIAIVVLTAAAIYLA